MARDIAGTIEDENPIDRNGRNGRFERLCDEQLAAYAKSMDSDRAKKRRRLDDGRSEPNDEVETEVDRSSDDGTVEYNDECRWCWEGGCQDRRPLDVECERRGIYVSSKKWMRRWTDRRQMHVETMLHSPPSSSCGKGRKQAEEAEEAEESLGL